MIAPSMPPGAACATARAMPIGRAAPRSTRRASRDGEWRWLPEVSAMAVAIDDGAQPLVLGVASTAGFLRIVDRNAIVIDIPRHCALHRALSRPGRAPGITLRCRNPHAAHESVCVQGFGSVGPAHPDAASADSGLVCFRMTAFAVSWLCDGPAPQSSNLPEAS